MKRAQARDPLFAGLMSFWEQREGRAEAHANTRTKGQLQSHEKSGVIVLVRDRGTVQDVHEPMTEASRCEEKDGNA